MKKIECFKIRLLTFDSESNIFEINKGKTLLDIKGITPYKKNPSIILADPFLFVYNDSLFLFYEEKRLNTPGVIKMISTCDLYTWSSPITVLEEPFHLSFPWVFEENGTIYMLPETGSQKSVRLYKSTNNDLSSFEFVKELIKSPKDKIITMGYGDSCIYKTESKYFLFTMLQYEDNINCLELYISDKVDGNYTPHPLSPIIKSQKTGRNAGCLLLKNNKLYRFSQDCTKKYGDNVNISIIHTLTSTNYQEELIKENILPTEIDFYKKGGHQFNAVNFKGKWIVATDAKEYHYLLGQRILNRISKL